MTVIVTGLKNCDTCKKARMWLDAQGIKYTYKDVRIDGLDVAQLRNWIAIHGAWQPFVNRRGTTWRNLDEKLRDNLDENNAVALLIANPTLMKRPVITVNKHGKTSVTVGFTIAEQAEILNAAGRN